MSLRTPQRRQAAAIAGTALLIGPGDVQGFAPATLITACRQLLSRRGSPSHAAICVAIHSTNVLYGPLWRAMTLP